MAAKKVYILIWPPHSVTAHYTYAIFEWGCAGLAARNAKMRRGKNSSAPGGLEDAAPGTGDLRRAKSIFEALTMHTTLSRGALYLSTRSIIQSHEDEVGDIFFFLKKNGACCEWWDAYIRVDLGQMVGSLMKAWACSQIRRYVKVRSSKP